MQVENLLALLQEASTVGVKFEGTPSKVYTYKVRKEWNVQVGDELVVRTPLDGSTIVEVVEVHDIPDIDLAANFKYKWAVQKVDNTAYDEVLKVEAEKAMQLKELQRKAQLKKQLVSVLSELGDEAQEVLKAIPRL